MTAPADLLLNRYRRSRLLGSGGFGAVYLAEDTRLGRAVAIKEMDANRLGADERAVAEQMFEREARMLAALDHPGLTKIWDFFQVDRRAFLVMEYVPGQTLRELVGKYGPLDPAFVIECGVQLCNVLRYLHARRPQVIFRDLKPANVMVVPEDEPTSHGNGAPARPPLAGQSRFVLIDFGIARLFKPEQSGDTHIIGTPGYAPPEQYGRGQTDPRSDIYSLGATLHHLLSGQVPSSVPPPPLAALNPAVPPELARIVARATAEDPADRYPSADALRADLLALQPRAPASTAPAFTPAAPAYVAPRPAPAPADTPRVTVPLPQIERAPRPPRQSPAAAIVLLLALLGIAAIGTIGLRAFGRVSGGGGTTPTAGNTAAPPAQEWLLPGASGTIAFGQGGQDGFDIWAATLDGKPPRRLTDDRQSYSPAWSPDGQRLSITRNTEIYIGSAGNPHALRLALPNREARYPAWSPDGRRLAMATREKGQPWRLTIVDLESGQVSFPAAPENIAALAWAPGQRLAFAAPPSADQPQDIFMLDADGTAANLTSSPDREEDFPAWSPDGRTLAFTSSPPGSDGLSQRQITVMRADGSRRSELTAGAGPHTNAVWSPDGEWIAYVAREDSPDWQVWAMRADGSDQRRLTSGPARKFYLSWGR
ncbi:protein kinase domain-containing protein [Kouleothrix sp.]|uniref:protein kinase domain-containing protein n=1 Tax=Kouleothrix sp. TaxID=2779161 RepID=UPI00391AC647